MSAPAVSSECVVMTVSTFPWRDSHRTLPRESDDSGPNHLLGGYADALQAIPTYLQLAVAKGNHAGCAGLRRAVAACDDGAMNDEVLAGQVAYYRRRAGEYDETAYGDVAQVRPRIARLVAQMRPSGRVLEIACGTGLWTEPLAHWADTVTAIDAAPEALALARQRVPSPHVTFEVADVFSWASDARYDVIFFSAWLSHVPTSRFDEFWQSLRGRLADGGRVLFLDEHVDVAEKEAWVPGVDGIVERQLRDGTSFRIVKNFVDPEALEQRLRQLGWDCTVRRDGHDWIYGEARPHA